MLIKFAHVVEDKDHNRRKNENTNDLYRDAETSNCKSIIRNQKSLHWWEAETFDQGAIFSGFHVTTIYLYIILLYILMNYNLFYYKLSTF